MNDDSVLERILGSSQSAQDAPLPPVSVELVTFLKARFEVGIPDVDATMAQVQREAGRQEVVVLIENLYNQQE